MSNTSSSSSGGIGITGLLTIIFLVLKLTHVIDWSWWWVFSPLLIGAGFTIVILLIMLLMVMVAAIATIVSK